MHQSLVISNITVKQDEKGHYCLNDFHRAAGSESRHQPSNFLRADGIKALIAEIDQSSKVMSAYINVGGVSPGTFVCKELVYAYAMWISSAFHLHVIRAYEASITKPSVPLSTMDILQIAMESEKGRLAAIEQLAIAAPKVAFVERYVESTGLRGFREVCKLLGANESHFRLFLIDKKIMYRLGSNLMPMAQHLDAGRFIVKTGEQGGHAFNTAKFTAKGVEWVAGLWAVHGLKEAA